MHTAPAKPHTRRGCFMKIHASVMVRTAVVMGMEVEEVGVIVGMQGMTTVMVEMVVEVMV